MLQKGFDQFGKLGCRWRYGRLLSAYLDTELSERDEEVITGHLRECARCRVEFEQLRFASRALNKLEIPMTRGSLPGVQLFQLPEIREVSPFKRLYSQKIAVPLPLAAGVVIALISATLFAIGGSQQTPIETVLVPAPSSELIKVVEVPVERVVTRTVYSRQSGSSRVRGVRPKNGFNLRPPGAKGDIAQNASRDAEWSDSTLRDFRPAASANLRVVKEHEK